MRVNTRRAMAVAVALGLLVIVPSAQADETVYAGPPNQFYTGSVTIDQGEKVTFTNLDTVDHDVTAAGKGPDGKPLFSSPLGGPGSSAPGAGTEYLTTGAYDFGCSIHPQMHGTLTVTSAGTPQPRPGSGGSGSAPAEPAQPAQSGDTKKPKVQIHIVDTQVSQVRRRKALRLHIATDEAVTVGVRARAGKTTFAATTTKVDSGGKTISLKLTKAGRRLVKRNRSLRLSLTARASDAAHNTVSAKGVITLSR